jgi:hypothetical protein
MVDPVQHRSRRDMLLAAACVLGTMVTFRFTDYLGPTEFSGGTLTSHLMTWQDNASVLFLLAAVLALFFRRISASMAVVGAGLAAPLYIYLIAPGPFRSVFPGNYSSPLTTRFVWDPWSLAGVGMVSAVILLAIRAFRPVRRT